MTAPPLFVLGVRRSGTTLLRVMLDRNTELAIPDESYFIPQLVHRHPRTVDPASFLDDVRRLPTLVEWGVSAEAVAERLRPDMTPGQAVGAVFAAYAAVCGKSRWGDKTPLYMQYLPLLERTFPEARFVHLVRDGRDAAVSFLSVPRGIMTEGWGHPTDAAGFARLWRTEVVAARALGRRVGAERYLEVRYEAFVREPAAALQHVCVFADLEYQADMLEYVGRSDSALKPHQQRLNQPPTPGVRDWRTDLAPSATAAFEAVAGDLLGALGYETRSSGHLSGRGRLGLGVYRAKTSAWRGVGYVMQRSSLWRRRHPPVA